MITIVPFKFQHDSEVVTANLAGRDSGRNSLSNSPCLLGRAGGCGLI